MELTADQMRRYARHILLPDVGGVGQRRLLSARVAVDVTPPAAAAHVALAYLAAAGVGRIALAGDTAGPVRAAEVATGILLGAGDVGAPRGAAIARRLRALNPDVAVALGAEADDVPLAIDSAPTAGRAAVADALVAGGAAAATFIARVARGDAPAEATA
ncbi:MAG: hypothetical protein D6689_18320 [Deltaproteobacteria bacterium]|nr:MAG: hypothetical protein D6689_18320 [Deltaproteobacteria bacterium]